MTQTQLIQHITSFDQPIKAVKLRTKLKEQSFSLRELVDLTFYDDGEIALKASKILQHIMLKFPQNYCGDITYLVEQVTEVECIGCKKNYAKILMHITSPEVPREVRDTLKDVNFEQIVELCFNWMKDPKMLTIIRGYAAETLFNLRHRYPWIAEALSNQLEAIMPGATPMLFAKGNYILSFLHPED